VAHCCQCIDQTMWLQTWQHVGLLMQMFVVSLIFSRSYLVCSVCVLPPPPLPVCCAGDNNGSALWAGWGQATSEQRSPCCNNCACLLACNH
jgi:hypothetical protein